MKSFLKTSFSIRSTTTSQSMEDMGRLPQVNLTLKPAVLVTELNVGVGTEKVHPFWLAAWAGEGTTPTAITAATNTTGTLRKTRFTCTPELPPSSRPPAA